MQGGRPSLRIFIGARPIVASIVAIIAVVGGASSSNFSSASAAVNNSLLVSAADPFHSVINEGETFFTSDVTVNTNSGDVFLAGSADGTQPFSVDDILDIEITQPDGTVVPYVQDFSGGCSGNYPSSPVSLSGFLGAGVNKLHIVFRDGCGSLEGNTDVYLTGDADFTGGAGTNGGFTVSGSLPVQPNPSQDTHDQTPTAKCNAVHFRAAEAVGATLATEWATAGLTASAKLMTNFLAGTGAEVDFPAGSATSNEAKARSVFKQLDKAVQAEVVRQLNAGNNHPVLTAPTLTRITFGGKTSDLFWGFRGTQGLIVSGNGSLQNGHYIGTLQYVIQDSYGFPPKDKLLYFGPQMRYLQTNCGAPYHSGGAHWFPDTITITVPFNQPASR